MDFIRTVELRNIDSFELYHVATDPLSASFFRNVHLSASFVTSDIVAFVFRVKKEVSTHANEASREQSLHSNAPVGLRRSQYVQAETWRRRQEWKTHVEVVDRSIPGQLTVVGGQHGLLGSG